MRTITGFTSMSATPPRVLDVWNAVVASDAEALRSALDARTIISNLWKICDNHGWTILHHAAAGHSLECVRLVTTRLKPKTRATCYEGFTPLARACERGASYDIISFLIQLDPGSVNIGNIEEVSPLHYAVLYSRLDLVEILVANGARVHALDYSKEGPACTAAFDTGHIEILIYLLFYAKSPCPKLRKFCARACYAVEKKTAIFKILFNLKYPEHMHRQRYEWETICPLALLSHRSTSLIPYFIETELKWEKNEAIQSVYKRLLNANCGLLAMVVVGEVKDATRPLKDWPEEFILQDLKCEIVQAAFTSLTSNTEEQFAGLMESVFSIINLSKSVIGHLAREIFQELTDKLLVINYGNELRQLQAYQRIVDCLMESYEGSVDELVAQVLTTILSPKHPLIRFIIPFLSYCTDLFMRPEIGEPDNLNDTLRLFCHTIGSMETLKGLPNHHCFPLKRLARDTIRRQVLDTMPKLRSAGYNRRYRDNLNLLDLPNRLKLYLQYCDRDTIETLLAPSEN
ncbi:uncharacterized protein LOC131267039 isoform X2 [Anopheles coustani]|uniref:uncharacterized protein LOC131267039 isoform X2 n=1 Tax=Anopheles coustani TaxID=139045 RepID=UPI002659FB45|nr:uncharacterized protein LOC131267039 isoform X2 [Anopheles coustani]